MKKTLLLFVLMLCAAPIIAQDSPPLSTKSNIWIEQPDILIKGEELKNYPSITLQEMLIGRIPGYDLTLGADAKFLFVVDGMILRNISAININDIDEIAFYRGGLSGKLGIHNNPDGVILITTRSAAFKQPFAVDVSAMAGFGFLKNGVFKDGIGKKYGYPQSYRVAFSEGLEKFSWRTGVTFSNDLSEVGNFNQDNIFQLNGDFKYDPLKWLSIGAGINYAPGNIKTVYNGNKDNLIQEITSKRSFDIWNGSFALKAQPLKGLVNEFRVLNEQAQSDDNMSSTYGYEGSRYYGKQSLNEDYDRKYFSLMNNLNYSFSADQDKIKFKVSAIYLYNRVKNNLKTEFVEETVPATNKYIYSGSADAKHITNSWIGEGAIDLYNILFVQAGVTRDKLQSHSLSPNNSESVYAPYFSARLNLKDVLLKDVNVINDFSLLGSLSKYRTPLTVTGSGRFTGREIFDREDDKMKTQNYGASASLFNNRLHLSGDWIVRNGMGYSSFDSNNQSYLVSYEVQRTGWRVWSSAEILRNTPLKWNVGLSVYQNNFEFRLGGNDNWSKSPTNNGLNYKPSTQFGFQQQFIYNSFSLNINGYAYFNNLLPNIDPNTMKFDGSKSNYLNLNYVALGYVVKQNASIGTFKDLKLNLIGRNLIQYKKNTDFPNLSRKIAVGVSARL